MQSLRDNCADPVRHSGPIKDVHRTDTVCHLQTEMAFHWIRPTRGTIRQLEPRDRRGISAGNHIVAKRRLCFYCPDRQSIVYYEYESPPYGQYC